MDGSLLIWLDSCYMKKVLQKSENDYTIEVDDITVQPATAEGDNYGSDLYRVNLTLSRVVQGQKISDIKSVLAKVLPRCSSWAEEDSIDNFFFLVEIAMMSETLPIMNKILDDKFIGISLAAESLYAQSEEPIHLILEDLAPKGFIMADRLTGLDLDHCLLTMRNLAAFHASSLALVEKDPKAAENYKRGIFYDTRSAALRKFYSEGTKSLGEKVAKWPELNPRISEKIINLSDIIYEKTCKILACGDDEFRVINHGDLWTNNLMFRYDDRGKPIEQIFVDFQFSYYGSPAMDLIQFLVFSPSKDLRFGNPDFILKEYHKSLVKISSDLDCQTEIPSFEDLKTILEKLTIYEMLLTFTGLPVTLFDKTETKNIEKVKNLDGKYLDPVYKGQFYRQIMTRLLPMYDQMGLLDP